MELMQRRFDRQEADRKMELCKQEAQARCNKLQAKAEMDKRDAQARCDKLEAKAEIDKWRAKARCDKLEAKVDNVQRELKAAMDKRDAQVRGDKLETKVEMGKQEVKAEMDKRDAQAKAEMDKREVQAKVEMLKDMLLQQQQIAQLKWEATTRPGQTPQLYSSPAPPLVAPPSYILQQPHPSSVNPAVLLDLHGDASGVQKMGQLKATAADAEKPSSQIALTAISPTPADIAVADIAVADVAAVITPAAKSVALSSQQHQKPTLPIPEHPPHTTAAAASSRPMHSTSSPPQVKVDLQQSHLSNNRVPAKSTGVGPVPLPGGARSHFFLSHAQSTGGDQTNAIYLELQQLGFTCWYVTHLQIWVSISMLQKCPL
jgi:hypothetical protein